MKELICFIQIFGHCTYELMAKGFSIRFEAPTRLIALEDFIAKGFGWKTMAVVNIPLIKISAGVLCAVEAFYVAKEDVSSGCLEEGRWKIPTTIVSLMDRPEWRNEDRCHAEQTKDNERTDAAETNYF